MHALHGNGPPGTGAQGWATVGRRAPGVQLARELQDLQPAGKLRSSGWTIPASVDDSTLVRVYDTRLVASWTKQLLVELGVNTSRTLVIGGDFLTSPHLVDGVAVGPQMVRWGPPGGGPYHLWIPPWPHSGAWLERCRQQVGVEAPGTRFTVGCVVPRDVCGKAVHAALVRRLVPASSAFLRILVWRCARSCLVSVLLFSEFH